MLNQLRPESVIGTWSPLVLGAFLMDEYQADPSG